MARALLIAFIFFGIHAHARDLEKLYEKAQFRFGNKKFQAYIADTDSARNDGLMFVKSLPVDTGMLFVFENERPLSFWMKNTLIPLSIAFLDEKAVIIDIQEMQVAASLLSLDVPTYPSRKPALFALEMEKGWFARNNIRIGARLERLAPVKSQLLSRKLKVSGH